MWKIWQADRAGFIVLDIDSLSWYKLPQLPAGRSGSSGMAGTRQVVQEGKTALDQEELSD